jgi:hypothetical protein
MKAAVSLAEETAAVLLITFSFRSSFSRPQWKKLKEIMSSVHVGQSLFKQSSPQRNP